MVKNGFILLALFFVVLSFNVVKCHRQLLKNYEKLNYSPLNLERRKRWIDEKPKEGENEESVDFEFVSHGKTFHLKLWPDNSAFHDEHLLDVNDQITDLDKSFLYQGKVIGDDNSLVYGSILDGIFDGHIHLGDGAIFHVEKSIKYLGKIPTDHHSIIYEESAIDFNRLRRKRDVNDNSHTFCGLNSEEERKMNETQNSAEFDERTIFSYKSQDNLDAFPERYLYAKDIDSREKRQILSDKRYKHEMINGRKVFRVRTCSLYMQADHFLYNHIYHHEGQKDDQRTREEILSLFYNHIKAVNIIYEETSFDGINGINFIVQRTSIYNGSSCNPDGTAKKHSTNPFCAENMDVSNYLNLNSKRNHSSFCLAYALTYRDFVGGTLGLAWVASPQPNTAGGICQVYQKYNERRGWVWRSLNTGIITLVNYGNRVPARVSQLTLAHEIGHNFGSPHDYPAYCQPGLPDGNYIMFASATSGDKRNNAKFSTCAKANVSAVLFSVLLETPVDPQKSLYSPSGGKRNCFQERTSSFCGNQFTEPGEQCDCGFTQSDCDRMSDKCCTPHKIESQGQTGCKRKNFAQCSPSEGHCCDGSSCKFTSSSSKCADAAECTQDQFCNGRGAKCPKPPSKPDGTRCQENTKICQSGQCNASVCALVDLEECFITEGTDEDKCMLACKKKGICMSSFKLPELAFLYQANRLGILLRPGSACNNYKGYCDIFRKCRSVDSNGPLARLKKFLFNPETFVTVKEWVREHWWAVVLMAMALVLVMAMFIKCCAVHTPSTNPNKPPAQSIYETLRRPASLLHAGHRTRNGRSGDPRGRQHRSRHRRGGGRSGGEELNGAPAPSAPPPPNIIIEPPPPYSAVSRDPAVPVPGNVPKRGHRRNKRSEPTNRANLMEMRPKRV